MKVLQLNFYEQPEFNDQFVRSYETNLKAGMIDDAVRARTEGERYKRDNVRDYVTTRQVSRIATDMIRPSGNSGISDIAGGWRQRRMRFVMVVETVTNDWHVELNYITGYTDHSEFSVRGRSVDLDPDMRMYFNSISVIHMLEYDEGYGRQRRARSEGHDQVLTRNVFSSRGHRSDPSTMRPVDLPRRQIADSAVGSRGSYQNTFNRVINRSGSFQSTQMMSSRRNNSPTSYLHRSLNTYQRAAHSLLDDPSGHTEQRNIDALNAVVDNLEENLIDLNRFVDGQLRDGTNFLRSGYVTYGELEALNPGLNEGNTVQVKEITQRDREMYIDALSNRSDTTESHCANILASSLSSLMLDASISRIEDLVINSMAAYEEDRLVIGLPFPYLDGADITESTRELANRFMDTIMPDITRNNAFSIEAHVKVIDIEGVIDVDISVDGGRYENYVFPLFADSLCAPTISDDLKRLEVVADDVISLAEGFFQSNLRKPTLEEYSNGRDGDGRGRGYDHSRADRMVSKNTW